MTDSKHISVPASDVQVGQFVVIHPKFAAYHGDMTLAGQCREIVAITRYPSQVSGFTALVGITLDGLPETCSGAESLITLEVRA